MRQLTVHDSVATGHKVNHMWNPSKQRKDWDGTIEMNALLAERDM